MDFGVSFGGLWLMAYAYAVGSHKRCATTERALSYYGIMPLARHALGLGLGMR